MSNEVMLTRIRLARNLRKYPFPCRLSQTGKNEVAEIIINAIKNCKFPPLANDLEILYVKDLSEAQRISLVEESPRKPRVYQRARRQSDYSLKGQNNEHYDNISKNDTFLPT